MKNIFSFLLLILSFNALSEIDRDKTIKKLLKDEIKMVENVKSKKPKLLYRLLELYSEELNIIKNRENENFLNNFAKGKKKKVDYFVNSIKRYKEVKLFGLDIIKKFPKNKFKADIYYTLALNSRDYGTDDQTEKYLNIALANTKEKDLISNIKSALGDHYYNLKKYDKAIALYSDLTKNHKDEWISKNTFNLAWCYLKTKKNEIALNTMIEAYYLGKQPGLVNIADQALSNLPLFFSVNEKIEDGLNFFTTEVKEPAEYILKMARRSAENGDYAGGLFLINKSKERFTKQSQDLQLLNINVFELDFYTIFKRWKKHKEASIDIVNIFKKLNSKNDLFDEAINKLKEHAGSIQKKIARNQKAGFNEFEGNLTKETIDYFDYLISLDHINKHKYLYFQGETSLSSKLYSSAIRFYKKSVEIALEGKSDQHILDIAQKSIESILYCIERTNDNKIENTRFAYFANTTLFPKTEKSQKIYPRYFALELKERKDEEAIRVLDKYIEHFPKDEKDHRKLFIEIVDFYAANSNTNKLAGTVNQMKKGKLSFDPTYIEKTEVVLGNILFKEFLKLENNSNISQAIEGYLSLFSYEHYPKNIRGRAAYNMAIAYSKISELSKSYEWLQKSFEFLDAKEKAKIVKSSLALSELYFLKQDFNISYRANVFLYNNFCDKSFAERINFYNNSVNVSLYADKYEETLISLESYKQCSIPEQIHIENINKVSNHLILFRRSGELANFSIKYKKFNNIVNNYYDSLVQSYWKSFWDNDEKEMITTINRIDHLKNLKLVTADQLKELKYIQLISDFQTVSDKFQKSSIYSSEVFNEEEFNGKLSSFLNELNILKSKSAELIKTSNSHIVLAAYHLMDTNFKAAAEKLTSLVLKIEDQNYKNGLMKHMNGIADKMLAESEKYLVTLRKTVNKNIIFSPYTKYTQNNEAIRSSIGLFKVDDMMATFDM